MSAGCVKCGNEWQCSVDTSDLCQPTAKGPPVTWTEVISLKIYLGSQPGNSHPLLRIVPSYVPVAGKQA